MSAPRPLDVMVVGDLFTELVMSGFSSWPGRAGEELFAERFCREIGGGAAILARGLSGNPAQGPRRDAQRHFYRGARQGRA